MNLLFQPEPIERLKSRFTQALTPVYTPELMRTTHPKAIEQRKHLFDFEDGTRLCISHEQLGQRLYLHITCSMDRRCLIRTANFPNVCYVKLCELTGKTLKILQTDSDDLSVHILCEPIPEAIPAIEGTGQHAPGALPPGRDQV
jgi:hypothetical protein